MNKTRAISLGYEFREPEKSRSYVQIKFNKQNKAKKQVKHLLGQADYVNRQAKRQKPVRVKAKCHLDWTIQGQTDIYDYLD